MAAEQQVGFVQTATIHGIEAIPVTVEISIGSGLPGFHIIGLPDLAVKEATRRVRQAIRAAGFKFRNSMVVVNLAPSSLKKAGSGFDLPIALAYLIATGQISKSVVDDCLVVGELSLDATVRAVKGQLAYERLAGHTGQALLTGPSSVGFGFCKDHFCIENLRDASGGNFSTASEASVAQITHQLDFSDIAGNGVAKRALQIAAAGNHGILMIGPPGSGKSMMARRLPTILPAPAVEARLESALIHSVAGLPYAEILAGQRPFRSPHHGASRAGLVGGGNPIMPGEITLAHNGVLFLDELPEFGGSVLQLLRQPIESGYVSLARAAGTVTFPSEFMLVAAANPCPCGYLGDEHHACQCTPAQVSRYMGRVGGPLLDRIHLIVDVSRSAAAEVLASGQGVSSATLKAGVERAIQYAEQRNLMMPAGDLSSASSQPSREAVLLAQCRLGQREQAFLEMVSDRYQLSGRAIISTLAVARTIADLDEQPKVSQDHLLEAVGYRLRGAA